MFKQEKHELIDQGTGVSEVFNNSMKNNEVLSVLDRIIQATSKTWRRQCFVCAAPPGVVTPDSWKHFRWDLFSYLLQVDNNLPQITDLQAPPASPPLPPSPNQLLNFHPDRLQTAAGESRGPQSKMRLGFARPPGRGDTALRLSIFADAIRFPETRHNHRWAVCPRRSKHSLPSREGLSV